MRRKSSVLCAVLALAACHRSDDATPSLPIEVVNLGLGVSGFPTVERRGAITFVVSEGSTGGVDLNGDGDALDGVIHRYHYLERFALNLRLAARIERDSGLSVIGPGRGVFAVSEAAQGETDLNGDGDTDDRVLHLFSPGQPAPAPESLNLRLAVNGEQVVRNDTVAFLVSELAQGGEDRNGDGDTGDEVLHVHDPDAGTLNLALAVTGPLALDALGNLAFAVGESRQGALDLNGDGDALDLVVHVLPPGGPIRNLGLALRDAPAVPFLRLEIRDRLLAFSVGEVEQGAGDLNGDGDFVDSVLHVHDVETGRTTNTALSSHPRGFHVGRGFVAVVVSEFFQGQGDLNGDGDEQDHVLHVHDAATGVTTNLGHAVSAVRVDRDLAMFTASEDADGNRDHNADGDALDDVLFLFLPASGQVRNLGLASHRSFRRTDDRVVFEVLESSQGGADLNGDGDASDSVLYKHDVRTAESESLGVSGLLVGAEFGLIAYLVPEEDQDLNGDGDLEDDVFHLISGHSRRTLSLGLAAVPIPLPEEETGGFLFPVLVPESSQGDADLNGDGDMQDSVLFVAEIHFRA